MSVSMGKPELNNEHRFMALLALTSQQLPEVRPADNSQGGGMNSESSKAATSFEQLDADPAALESFLRRHAATPRPARRESRYASAFETFTASLADLFAPRAVRYVAAVSVAAVAALLITQTVQRSEMPSLRAGVEHSYAAAQFDSARSPLSALVLPWERPPSSVGFSPGIATGSRASVEFAQGLVDGRQRLMASGGAVQGSSANDSVYALLGEWNVVLWAIGESGQAQSAEWWRSQLQVSDAFAAHAYDDAAAERITAHLATVRGILMALSNGENPARNARALADELLLFREQFAPHQLPAP
jgi:hypothetical protein